MAMVAEAGGATRALVEGERGKGEEGVGGWNGGWTGEVTALRVAGERWRWEGWKRDVEAVAVQELRLDVGEGGGRRNVIGGEQGG